MSDKLKKLWESPLFRCLCVIVPTLIIITVMLSVGHNSKNKLTHGETINTDTAVSNISQTELPAPSEPASIVIQPVQNQTQANSNEQVQQSKPQSQEQEESSAETETEEALMLNADVETVDKLSRAISNNSDTIGWLKINGTKCDYAVMQSDDNDYYLEHNEQKKKSKYGALFADYRCRFDNGNISHNTVIYGHSMKDGSMFTQLFSYKKLSVLNNQPIVEFSYNGCTQNKWVIFACMVTDINFNYIEPNPGDAQYVQMIDEIRQRSMFDTDVDVTKQDRILLLSTCTYEYPDEQARFVVAARQLRRGEDENIKVNARKNEDVKKPIF